MASLAENQQTTLGLNSSSGISANGVQQRDKEELSQILSQLSSLSTDNKERISSGLGQNAFNILKEALNDEIANGKDSDTDQYLSVGKNHKLTNKAEVSQEPLGASGGGGPGANVVDHANLTYEAIQTFADDPEVYPVLNQAREALCATGPACLSK